MAGGIVVTTGRGLLPQGAAHSAGSCMGAARSCLGFSSTIPGPISGHPRGAGSQQCQEHAPGPVPKQSNFAFFLFGFLIIFRGSFVYFFASSSDRAAGLGQRPGCSHGAHSLDDARTNTQRRPSGIAHCLVEPRAVPTERARPRQGRAPGGRQCEAHAPPTGLV